MEEVIPYNLPTIEDEEISEVVATLRSGWLSSIASARFSMRSPRISPRRRPSVPSLHAASSMRRSRNVATSPASYTTRSRRSLPRSMPLRLVSVPAPSAMHRHSSTKPKSSRRWRPA